MRRGLIAMNRKVLVFLFFFFLNQSQTACCAMLWVYLLVFSAQLHGLHVCAYASLESCSASKRPGHGCNSHSISCVQIGRSNNSIAAANSLMDEAQVQKSRIMQSRPSGNCCPKAISFNIGQTSIGITHQLNKSSHTSYLIFMPASFSLKYKVPHTHMDWGKR